MKRKNVLSLLLVAVMAISLVGCGSKDETVADTNTTEKIEEVESIADDSQDEVKEEQAGVSGPADEVPTDEETAETVEEPVEEVKANIITLMTADGSEVLQTFEVPEGYTVVSSPESNNIELVNEEMPFLKVYITSGVNMNMLKLYLADNYCLLGENSYNEAVEKMVSEMGVTMEDICVDDCRAFWAESEYTLQGAYSTTGAQSGKYYRTAYKDHIIYPSSVPGEYDVCCSCLPNNPDDIDSINLDEYEFRVFEYYAMGENDDNGQYRYMNAEQTWTISVVLEKHYESPYFEGYPTAEELIAAGEDPNTRVVAHGGDGYLATTIASLF